jgi:hypothetical protein
MRRETRGGELDLIRVLRHDLPGEQEPTVIQVWRLVVVVLAAVSSAVMALQFFR